MGTNIIFNYITVVVLLGMPILAQANCFLVKEQAKALVSEGDCDSRHAPRCSFNIALSLMAYNEGILSSETKPEYPFKEGYPDYVARWQQPHNPGLWIKNSCVWYSHLITKDLGQKKIQEYLLHFAYGNQDFSGDTGKDNALTRAWMSGSSLRISPNEQITFLQKVVDRKLQVNDKSYQMTKNIFFVDELDVVGECMVKQVPAIYH